MASNWDAETMGFGKHDYRAIDPDTINVNDFARNLRGDEAQFGDVREYNSAYNTKHPENDLELDWLGRAGSIFETDAPGWEGMWIVTNQPVILSPDVFCRCAQITEVGQDPAGLKEVVIPCVDLGSAVDKDNLFRQVRSKLLKKGDVSRTQRVKLTKKK